MKKIGGLPINDPRLPYIKKGIRLGMSANKIQKSLKGTEYKIRRETCQAVVREYKGFEKGASRIQYLRETTLPSRVTFGYKGEAQRDEYLYGCYVYGKNMETKEPESFSSMRGYHKRLTKKEVMEWIKKDVEGVYLEDVEVKVVRATRRTW